MDTTSLLAYSMLAIGLSAATIPAALLLVLDVSAARAGHDSRVKIDHRPHELAHAAPLHVLV